MKHSFVYRKTLSLVLAIVMVLSIVPVNVFADHSPTAATVLTVEEARATGAGEAITVRGIVTTHYAPGAAGNAFFLQSPTGTTPESGILVRVTGATEAQLSTFVGYEVEVTGIRNGNVSGAGFVAVENVTVAGLQNIERIANATVPSPVPVTFDQLSNREFQSMLVSIEEPTTLLDETTGPNANPNRGISVPGEDYFVIWQDPVGRGFHIGDRVVIHRGVVHWWDARDEVQIRLIDLDRDLELYEAVSEPYPVEANLVVTLSAIADFHGMMNSENSVSDPGFARFVTFVNAYQERIANETGHYPVLLHAGDTFFGQSINNLMWGEPSLRVLNRLGVRYGAIGNHEFSWQNRLLSESFGETDPVRRAEMLENVNRNANPIWETLPSDHPLNVVEGGIPFLAADLVYESGHPNAGEYPDWLQPYAILDDWYDEYGISIALIGLTHPNMASLVGPMDRAGLNFRTPRLVQGEATNFEWLEEMITLLRDPNGPYGVNAVVALTHTSSGHYSQMIVDTLQQRGHAHLDGFFSGHSHNTQNTIRAYNNLETAIVLGAHHGRGLGDIQLGFNSDGELIHLQGNLRGNVRAYDPDPEVFEWVHGVGATWTRSGTGNNLDLDLEIHNQPSLDSDRADWGWEQVRDYWWGRPVGPRVTYATGNQHHRNQFLVNLLYDYVIREHANDLSYTTGEPFAGTVIINNQSAWRGQGVSELTWGPEDSVNTAQLMAALTFENTMPLFEIRGRDLIEMLNMPGNHRGDGETNTPQTPGRITNPESPFYGQPNWFTMQGSTVTGAFYQDGTWYIATTLEPISPDGIYRLGASNHLFGGYGQNGGQHWPLPGNNHGNALGFHVIDFIDGNEQFGAAYDRGPNRAIRDTYNDMHLTIQETWLRETSHRAHLAENGVALAAWIEVDATEGGVADLAIWGLGTRSFPGASTHSGWGLPAYGPESNTTRDLVLNGSVVRATATIDENSDDVFLGWFADDVLVSRDEIFIFNAEADITLEARFGEDEGMIAPRTFEFQILHTNDLHGHFGDWRYPSNQAVTGLGRLATVIENERNATFEKTESGTWDERTLLIDLGDTIQGNASAAVNSPAWDNHPGNVGMNPTVYGLEALGFDVFTLGNHEFDFGVERLYHALGFDPETGAPAPDRAPGTYFSGAVLAGNVVDNETRESAFDAYYIHDFSEQGGPRIAIIGMLPETTIAYNYQWLSMMNLDTSEPGAQTAEVINWLESEEAYELYGNIDFYIGGMHLGHAAARAVLATEVPGHDGRLVSDYIIGFMGGHAHAVVDGALGSGPGSGVRFSEAGRWGNRLGIMRFEAEFSPEEGWSIDRVAGVTTRQVNTATGTGAGANVPHPNFPANTAFMTRPTIQAAHEFMMDHVSEPIATVTGPAFTPSLRGGNQFQEDSALQHSVHDAFIYFANTGIRNNPDPAFAALNERGAQVTVSMTGPLGLPTPLLPRNFNHTADADGYVRVWDIYGIYEFDNNTMGIVEITGHQLRLWLEHAYVHVPVHGPDDNLFPNITGHNSWRLQQGGGELRHTIDLTAPAWERVSLYHHDGTPFDLDTVLFVTANNHTIDSRSFIVGPGSGAAEATLRQRMLDLPASQTLNGVGGEDGLPYVHTRNAQFMLYVEDTDGTLLRTYQNSEGATGMYIEFIRSILRENIADTASKANFDLQTERFNDNGANFSFIMPLTDEVVLEIARNIINADIGIEATGTNASSRPNLNNIRANLNPQILNLWDLYLNNMDRENNNYTAASWLAFETAMFEAGVVMLNSGNIVMPVESESLAHTAYENLMGAIRGLTDSQGKCPTIATGQFAGEEGAQWRVCEDGTLEVGEGFINWTLATSPWHAHRADINNIVFTGPIRAGSSLRALFRDLTEVVTIEGLTNFDTLQTVDMANMFRNTSGVATLDLSRFDTSNVTNMNAMFMGSSLEMLSIDGFDTSNVTDMSSMFRETSSLEVLNISSFDTSNVTNMSNMFRGATALNTLKLGEGFQFIGNVHLPAIQQTAVYTGRWVNEESAIAFTSTQLVNQFDGETMAGTWVWQVVHEDICPVVLAEGQFTGAGGAMWWLCEDGTLEVTSGNINWTASTSPWQAHRAGIRRITFTGEIIAGPSLRALFRGLDQVETIEGLTYFNTSQTVNMANMFRDVSRVTRLDVSSFDTRNVASMNAMFMGASSLTNLDVTHFDTSLVLDMESMFRNTSSLLGLDVTGFNTARVITMANMFRNMSNLSILDLSSFDTSQVTDMRNMLNGLPSVWVLVLGENFRFVGSAHLQPIVSTHPAMTGRWVHMENATSEEQLRFTSSQLMANFNPETMSGFWIREILSH